MKHLIDKAALVAEIERLREEKGTFYASDVLYNLEDFIDTLEVKETNSNDAFIEKATAWLEEHKEVVETEDNGIMGWIPDYFIEDFKKYMSE